MAIIAIVSIGIYNAYLVLIRVTKDGEVRQRAALVGKSIIESIKADTEGKDFDITNKATLDLNDIISLDKKQSGPDSDGKKEIYFEKETHLNNDFKETTDINYAYIRKIKIEKAKAQDERDSNEKYDIDLDERKINVPTENAEVNKIVYNLKLTKELGSSSKIKISDDENTPVEVPKSSDGKAVINIYIKTEVDVEGNKTKNVSVKDFEGKSFFPEVKKLSLDDTKTNQLYLSINFDDYKKQVNENLETEVNIYDYDQETADSITNINVEKARDLDVDVNTKKGEVNIYNNRTESDKVAKLGTLYDIKVDLKTKDGEDLFTGYSNQNINIK